MDDKFTEIDLGKILKEKNPSMARFVPRFVVRYMEHLVRIKKINYMLSNFWNQPPVKFIESTIDYIGVTYKVHGVENIPTEGRVVFVANHPLGGLDGLILAAALSQYKPDLKFIVNDILMNLKPLAPIFVPINKHGSQSIDYARRITSLYESDSAIITFPAGLCSRLLAGKVTDTPWKGNFLRKATATARPIVPVYISGHNSKSFYRLALWRKRLGIKLNIEMILLPKEMFDQQGKHIDLFIGKPTIPTETTVEQLRQMVYNFEK